MLVTVALAAAVFLGGSALAASPDPLGFRFSAPAYTVHENAGAAEITIERINVTSEAQIRYLTTPGTAIRGQDYRPVRGMIDFLPGQASASFRVPIVDHHFPGLPMNFKVALFGPSPIGLAEPSHAVVTILEDDASTILQDPLNPLGLPTPPPASDPLTGAVAYVDYRHSLAGLQAHRWRRSHPRAAGMLQLIADQPQVQRYGNWSGQHVGRQVAQFLTRAGDDQPGAVPELSTYYLVHGHCHQCSDPPWRQGAYHKWIQSLAAGIGEHRAILFLEMDALITVGNLSRHGLAVRLHELHDAFDILSKVPHLVTYVDAGAGDAVPVAKTASMLRRAGVSEIRGFFVNSTHFDWTSREIRYGRAISRLTGGKAFVVNTAENGRGPLRPSDRVHHGNEVLCNPPGRGLGPRPTFSTGYALVDAFAWIANPGKSGGPCRPGAPPTGWFWPALALELVRHADFRVR